MIALGVKFPFRVCEIHVPLMVPIVFLNLLHVVLVTKVGHPVLLNNIANYMLLMVLGILCNGKWLYTVISIFVCCLGYILFYALYLNLYDGQFIIELSAISAFFCYASYFLEAKLKHEFVQMDQIQHMNDDLSNLLSSLPDGIVIYNERNGEVVLANQEFKRVFGAQLSTEQLEQKIRAKIIKPYNLMSQQQDQQQRMEQLSPH